MLRGKSRLPYLIISAAVLFIAFWVIIQPPLIIQMLENKTFDFRFLMRGERPVGNEIVVVAIDEESIAKVGRWPWPRAKMAELVSNVASRGARTIGVDILFAEPEVDQGNIVVRDILQKYQHDHQGSNGFLSYLKEKERDISGDTRLARAIAEAGNVILPFAMKVPLLDEGISSSEIPEALFFYSFMVVKEKEFNHPIIANGVFLPISAIEESAWSLGSAYTQYDRDGSIRWEPLAIQLEQYYFPSFGLEVARHYLGIKREDMKLVAGEGIVMGDHVISTDAAGRVLINYPGKSGTFPMISAQQVLLGNVPKSLLQDKIVLIGTTALGTSDIHVTPFAQLSGIEKQASVIENIIYQNFLTKEELIQLLNLGFVFLFCLIFLWFLPRLKAFGGALFTTCFAAIFLLTTQYLFIAHRWWVDLIVPAGAMLILYTVITAYRFLTEERRAREIRMMFSSYTTEKVVNELLENPELAKLGGVRREVTVLFSDVRSFTTFSENHTPEEVVSILNELLSAMTDVIMHWDGTLDKFVGDEIMAFWGAPCEQVNHAELATRCSLHMMQRLKELHEKWEAEGLEKLDIGIGLNSGEVVVGNIGAEGKKLDYTIIGDAVNLGARVEALTRNYDADIIITEYTHGKILDLLSEENKTGRFTHMQVTKLDDVKVKGKENSVVIYGLSENDHKDIIS